jgi:acyl-CoA synthetase (AMP-forming)/AMP-acid ligase II
MATAAISTALAGGLALYANSRLGIARDLESKRNQQRALRNHEAHLKRYGGNFSMYRLLELADPDADAIWFEGRSWNYRAMKAEVDNVTLGLIELGAKDGDIVSVFMTNSPEMVFIIYACIKLGVVASLMNSHLRDATLRHCVELTGSSIIVSTPDIAVHAAEAAKGMNSSAITVSLNLGSFRQTAGSPDVQNFPPPNLHSNQEMKPVVRGLGSTALFIFTSGTTGKPKACSIKNLLLTITSCPTYADYPLGYDKPDAKYFPLRIYSCMPLFHGTTFFTGICYGVGTSSCFCIGRKFSARNYWREVTEARASRILYVGELCRFLLATSNGEYDRRHRVKTAIGNGMQKDVWVAFQRRFGVPEVREFYRSTEGLAGYDNRHFATQGERGAGKVGFQGLMARRTKKDTMLVKFDYETEMPWRDPDTGFCVPAKTDEAGEAIGRIKSLDGYTDYYNNTGATEAKFLRDVFERGDLWQRMGDLLMIESSGWIKFVDRIGDTFRWNGENVSAGEIRGYIAELPEVQDAILVGKVLTGYDGQAGAAAIFLSVGTKQEEQTFMKSLCENLKQKGVPKYALPRLVVLTDEIKVGDTFKHAKQIVKAVDWSDVAGGKKYYLDVANGCYSPLDQASWGRIEAGKAKL